jgi:hypothetical protein
MTTLWDNRSTLHHARLTESTGYASSQFVLAADNLHRAGIGEQAAYGMIDRTVGTSQHHGCYRYLLDGGMDVPRSDLLRLDDQAKTQRCSGGCRRRSLICCQRKRKSQQAGIRLAGFFHD